MHYRTNSDLRERANYLLAHGETLADIALRAGLMTHDEPDANKAAFFLGLDERGRQQVTEEMALRLAEGLLFDPVDIDL